MRDVGQLTPVDVAPRTGARIETMRDVGQLTPVDVAPRAGARIETPSAWFSFH